MHRRVTHAPIRARPTLCLEAAQFLEKLLEQFHNLLIYKFL